MLLPCGIEFGSRGICKDLVPNLRLPVRVANPLRLLAAPCFLLSPTTTLAAVSSIGESTGSGSGNGGGDGLLPHIISYLLDLLALLAAAIF